MKKKVLGVKLQKSKSPAGVMMTVATYPNGKTRIFRNNAAASKEIKAQKRRKEI